MIIYFVTERYLKLYGMITANVDATDFTPLIQFCSKAFIKKQLGTYFFNDLLTKYNNQTLNEVETSLVEIMQFAIAWRATAEAAISLSYQIKNKGIIKQRDDMGDAAEMKEITFIYDNLVQKAQYFEIEMKEFIILNKLSLPIFTNTLNIDSMIKNNEHDVKGTDFNDGTGLLMI